MCLSAIRRRLHTAKWNSWRWTNIETIDFTCSCVHWYGVIAHWYSFHFHEIIIIIKNKNKMDWSISAHVRNWEIVFFSSTDLSTAEFNSCYLSSQNYYNFYSVLRIAIQQTIMSVNNNIISVRCHMQQVRVLSDCIVLAERNEHRKQIKSMHIPSEIWTKVWNGWTQSSKLKFSIQSESRHCCRWLDDETIVFLSFVS